MNWRPDDWKQLAPYNNTNGGAGYPNFEAGASAMLAARDKWWIAGMWSKGHRDTGYLLEVIWVTAAKNPNGSHLNYIQAIINKQNVEKKPVQQLKRY